MSQPGFFDLDRRYNTLNEGDPLISLNELIEWNSQVRIPVKLNTHSGGR